MPSKPLSDIEDLIGNSHTVIEDLHVEEGKVEEFTRSIDIDGVESREDIDRSARLPKKPAPLTFTRTGLFPRYRPKDIDDFRPFDLGFDPKSIVHGEQEYQFERPLFVGDRIEGIMTLKDVYQREGARGGTMTFAEFELKYRTEEGDLVLTEQTTLIETGGDND